MGYLFSAGSGDIASNITAQTVAHLDGGKETLLSQEPSDIREFCYEHSSCKSGNLSNSQEFVEDITSESQWELLFFSYCRGNDVWLANLGIPEHMWL